MVGPKCWNENGIVDGCVPAGRPCPFYGRCALRDEKCPHGDALKQVPFSCAAVRGWSLCVDDEKDQ
jgi:hypothetical protein